MRPRKATIILVSLIIGIVVYYSMATIAIFQYTEGFEIYNDLWTHLRWFEYNPDGALFFRIGNLIYGVMLLVFFLGFSVWFTRASELRFRTHLIQIIGVSMAASLIIGEILADQSLVFVIGSGMSVLFAIIILIGFTMSFYKHARFWTPSVLIFLLTIALSSFLLYMGAIDAPIRDFRVIDLLVTFLNQLSICIIAFNLVRMQTD
jgi:hypothetical protein